MDSGEFNSLLSESLCSDFWKSVADTDTCTFTYTFTMNINLKIGTRFMRQDKDGFRPKLMSVKMTQSFYIQICI